MVYCKECAKKHGWPILPFQCLVVLRECEICGTETTEYTDEPLRKIQKISKKAIESIQVSHLPKDFIRI